MSIKLNKRSINELVGVHPDLVALAHKAADLVPDSFVKKHGMPIISSGVRTAKEQNHLFRMGYSKLDGYNKLSQHQKGLAIDWAIIKGRAANWAADAFIELSKYVKKAAALLGLNIEWGGDWKGSWDKPHYQLSSRQYPNGASSPSRIGGAVVVPKKDEKEAVIKDIQAVLNKHGSRPPLVMDGLFGRKSRQAMLTIAGLKVE